MKGRINKISIIFSTIMLVTFLLCLVETPQIVKAADITLSAPTTVKAVSSSYQSITISWSGVTGASGYRVYRATSSTGTFTLVKTTISKSFKNTGLTTGKTYYYKIRAYKTSGTSKVYGKYSLVKSAKAIPATPTTVKAVSSSYQSIKISWSSVSGASGYRVYVAKSSTGSYSFVKTTTLNSYVNTGLTTGTTYYYKIRAYTTVGSSKVYSSYSAVVHSKPVLSKPTSVKAVSSTDGVIGICWIKTAGANGYEVYKASSSNGTYALLSPVTATSYNHTGLKAGTTCYYKVRAYRVIGSSKVYSSFSSVVSQTITVVNVTSVKLNKSKVTLILGNSDKLTASITPDIATNQSVMWKTSDNSVVTVDKKGNIASISAGTATITVTTADGSKTAQCAITVKKAEIKGIDVSKWQKTIDWDLVKSDGIEFAMLRAAYGSSNVDPMFETNYAAAKASGIAVGAYHYSYATTVAKAATEVKYLISKLEGKQFEYPICVDVEDKSQSTLDKETLTNIALTYLKGLKQAGYYPMIYTSKSWYTNKLDDTMLTDYDHWLAQWGTSITYSGAVGLWQYSSTGTVSGISGNVDLDTSFIDYEARIKHLGLNGF